MNYFLYRFSRNQLQVLALLAFICAIIFAVPATALAQSHGPNNPSNVIESQFACLSCPGTNWFGFNNVKAANDSFATTNLDTLGYCFQTQCYKSRALEASNYNFTIPLNATVTGIKAVIKRKSSALNAIGDSLVQLMKDASPVAGVNHANNALWDTADVAVSYGGPGDLWGAAWTAAEIDSTGFGVCLAVANHVKIFDTASVDNINVTVYYSLPNPPPVASFSASDTVICAGDSVQFTDQSTGGDTTRFWVFQGGTPGSSNSQSVSVTYPAPGQYNVTLVAVNAYGADTLLKQNLVTVDTLPPTPLITLLGDTLTSSSATGNQWYLNDTLIPGATGIEYVATISGSYSVVVTNIGNCVAASSAKQYIATGIWSLTIAPSLLNIIPNPAKGNFLVHFASEKNYSTAFIRVTDVAGNIVDLRPADISAGDNNYKFNMKGGIPAGIYLLELIADNQIWSQKLVIAD